MPTRNRGVFNSATQLTKLAAKPPSVQLEDAIFWVLILVIAAAPLTTVKVFDIQLAEFLAAMALGLAGVKFMISQKLQPQKNWLSTFGFSFRTLLSCLLLAALYDTWQLSIPSQTGQSFLKQPYFLPLARCLELFLSSHVALLIWKLAETNPQHLDTAAKVYSRVGLLACVFGVINFGLCRYGFEIPLWGKPSYINMPRAQGTFVEPGPFGLYVVSLICLELIRVKTGERVDAIRWILFTLSLLLTVSKAGFMALLLLAPICLITSKRNKIKIGLLLISLFLIPFLGIHISEVYINIISGINYDSHPLLDGRMMAYYALPKMLGLSPWLGIGLGNYPLMRNSPEILNGMPVSPIWDLHGSGLFGVCVEMGAPLFIAFIALLISPIRNAMKTTQDPWIKMALWFPIIAFSCGLQIHFIYPWLYLAIASGIVTSRKERENRRE